MAEVIIPDEGDDVQVFVDALSVLKSNAIQKEISITPADFGAIADGDSVTPTDNTIPFNNMFAFMSANKIPVRGDGGQYYLGEEVGSTGFADVDLSSCLLTISSYDGWGIRFRNTNALAGTWSNPVVADYLSYPHQFIDVPDGTIFKRGDIIHISDSTLYYLDDKVDSFRAEIFTVAMVTGNTLMLDELFTDDMDNGGVIRRIEDEVCKVNIRYQAEDPEELLPLRRNGVTVWGYAQPEATINCIAECTMSLRVMSCYQGRFVVVGKNFADDPDNRRYGYAAAAYGACKNNKFTVFAHAARHAYTDGISSIPNSDITNGACKGSQVTGIATSCTSAAWDTHQASDKTHFINCETYGSHLDAIATNNGTNSAYQMRGTNHTITGGNTDLYYAFSYAGTNCRIRKSINIVDGLVIRPHALAKYSNAFNVYETNEVADKDPYGTNAKHTLTVKNMTLHSYYIYRGANIDYVDLDNCKIIQPEGLSKPLFNNLTVANATAVHKWKNVSVGTYGGINLRDSLYMFDNVTFEPDGDGESFTFKNSNVVVHANNMIARYTGVNPQWGALFKYGASGDSYTGCVLNHSNVSATSPSGTVALAITTGLSSGTLTINNTTIDSVI